MTQQQQQEENLENIYTLYEAFKANHKGEKEENLLERFIEWARTHEGLPPEDEIKNYIRTKKGVER